MKLSRISPDSIVYGEWGPLKLNATIVFTWVVMAIILVASHLATRRIDPRRAPTRWQLLLELVVTSAHRQISETGVSRPQRYLPFIGTLFLLIATANALTVVPGYIPPTGSLSTTVALAMCVFFAVPIYGISQQGLRGFFGGYLRPSPLMLPFNIIGDLSRTLALAVRLFGNVMSGAKIAALFLAIAPLFVPVLMQALGLLTGLIQAYIFAVLALIYITSAVQTQGRPRAAKSAPEHRQAAAESEREDEPR